MERLFSIKILDKEEYSKIQDIIIKEYSQNKKDNIENFVFFDYYSQDLYGIYLNNKLVGLYRLSPFMGELSIDYYVLPEFRGNNIIAASLDNFVLQMGAQRTDIKCFFVNINPQNEKSLKILKKLGWKQTYNYDDVMLEEGAEFFYIFVKDNPFYNELTKSNGRHN